MLGETNTRDFERFNRLDAKLDRLLAAQDAANQHLALLESRITSLDKAVAHVHERLDGLQGQLDNVGRRLDRIERRLDLTDTPAAG
jgi:chromosome segregation ATPase